MTRDPRRLTELALHMHVAALLRRAAAPGVIWFHPANGEKRDKATAHKLQQMGVMPGVSDLVLMIPCDTFTKAGFVQPAFLELKAAGGRLTPEQRDFHDRASLIGCLVGVAYTPEAALDILKRWGAIRAGTTSVTRRNPAEVA
jgi:hypothetical protein